MCKFMKKFSTDVWVQSSSNPPLIAIRNDYFLNSGLMKALESLHTTLQLSLIAYFIRLNHSF